MQSYPREVQQVEPQGRRRAAAGEGRRANVKVQGHQDMNDKRQTASRKNKVNFFLKKYRCHLRKNRKRHENGHRRAKRKEKKVPQTQ